MLEASPTRQSPTETNKTRACMCAQQQKGVLKEDNKYSQQTETKQNQGKPLVNHGHES